jgi:hypothetical protein
MTHKQDHPPQMADGWMGVRSENPMSCPSPNTEIAQKTTTKKNCDETVTTTTPAVIKQLVNAISHFKHQPVVNRITDLSRLVTKQRIIGGFCSPFIIICKLHLIIQSIDQHLSNLKMNSKIVISFLLSQAASVSGKIFLGLGLNLWVGEMLYYL